MGSNEADHSDSGLNQTESEMEIESVDVSADIDQETDLLAELAKLEVGLDIVKQGLRSVKKIVGESVNLEALAETEMPVKEKQALLGFLQLVAGIEQGNLIPAEIGGDNLSARPQVETGQVVAEVTTVVEMDVEFSNRLERKLSGMLGRKVAVRSKIDPTIIGGIVIRIGPKVLDGSVSGQLEKMREQMLTDMRGK